MNVAITTLTPSYAAELLKLNTNNRPASKEVVAQYADLMRRGLWRENGDAVRISTDNVLLDGQHRLLAQVAAGVTLNVTLATGIAPEAFATIDRQYARAPSQMFAVAGIANHNNAATLSRMLVDYEAGRVGSLAGSGARRTGITTEELLAYYQRHAEEIQASVRGGYRLGGDGSFLRRTEWSFLHAILHRTGAHQQADEFLAQLATGAGLDKGDVVLMVRNRLLASMMSLQSNMPIATRLTYLVLAWNRVRAGRRAGQIQIHAETTMPSPD